MPRLCQAYLSAKRNFVEHERKLKVIMTEVDRVGFVATLPKKEIAKCSIEWLGFKHIIIYLKLIVCKTDATTKLGHSET